MPSVHSRKDSLMRVQDLVLYELAPYLNRRGAHVWLEVSRQHTVVAFTCWLDAERDALRDWVHERLRAEFTDRVCDAVIVDDRSAWRPALGTVREANGASR